LYEQRQWLQVTLSSIGDAVITTDVQGNINFLKPVAQELTGWMQEKAVGTTLDIVVKIVNEETRDTVENPAIRANPREGRLKDNQARPSFGVAVD
jgi:PAS domain S-box-containing protein